MSEPFSPRSMLIRSLTAYNNSRDRNQQIELGPSSIGGCKRQVYHQIRQDEETNLDTEFLAALLGTFIHTGIEESLRLEDPFGSDHLKELEVSFNGLTGHVDFYHNKHLIIVDWKTTVKKNLKDFPSQQYVYQVQVYGYLAIKNGLPVETVSLVAIPRDGKMSEIVEYLAPYDEKIALEGIAWLDDLKVWAASKNLPPAPEKYPSFCSLYCKWFNPNYAKDRKGCPSSV
jgi:hypothetical protein